MLYLYCVSCVVLSECVPASVWCPVTLEHGPLRIRFIMMLILFSKVTLQAKLERINSKNGIINHVLKVICSDRIIKVRNFLCKF